MGKDFKVRDMRRKQQYKIDDAYLNGYARLCGVYATAVYNSLSRHADFHTQECFPSVDKIAEQHNVNRKSVLKGIEELAKWGIIKIIKEKDPKTKRQLVNVYVLLDKSEWIPKPDTRVPVEDSEPSPSHTTTRVRVAEKSRVRVADCKDTQLENDTQFKVGDVNVADLQRLLDLFKNVNPTYERLFRNKTERAALQRLMDKFGVEKVESAINKLPDIINKRFAPRITTPYQLEKDLGKLIAFVNQEKSNNNLGVVKV